MIEFEDENIKKEVIETPFHISILITGKKKEITEKTDNEKIIELLTQIEINTRKV